MIILDPIVWTPQRYILNTHGINLTYYGFFYTLGFLLSIIIVTRLHGNTTNKEHLVLFMIVLAVGAMIGGRLGFVFCYGGSYYMQNPIEIFKTWKGGISSHGATLGIVFSIFAFKFYIKKSFFWLLDNALILSLLSGSLIRIGNFINSEKIGAATNSNWGVIFKNNSVFGYEPRHPTQLYESLICAILFFYFLYFFRKTNKLNGYTSSLILISLFGIRYAIGHFFSDSITNTEQVLNLGFVCFGALIFVYCKTSDNRFRSNS